MQGIGWRIIAAAVGAGFGLIFWITDPPRTPSPRLEISSQASPHRFVRAYVTGYNTVPKQTDASPCVAATGDNICGRSNVVACPRALKLGTVVEIHGRMYLCEDRTSRKFDGRFDISCDKDRDCPLKVAGWATVKVLLD